MTADVRQNRTLQRSLQAADSSYDALVDETRRRLSLEYLGDERMSLGEVAVVLGYSEPATFYRLRCASAMAPSMTASDDGSSAPVPSLRASCRSLRASASPSASFASPRIINGRANAG